MGKRDFARPHHVAFFDAMATELPDEYATQEVNHLTLGYFAVGGLSLLRELDRSYDGGFGMVPGSESHETSDWWRIPREKKQAQ
nr:unnamed protein product [Digitaria exilis]